LLARLDLGHLVDEVTRLLDPLAVGLGRRQLLLDFVVTDDAPLLQVDQQHLAGLQAPLLDNTFVGDRQHAGFRSHDDEIVVGHQIARRPQAIAVERGADLAAIGERHRRRAVPWFHQGHVVLVEGATLFIHERVAGPGFGDQHHHGVGEAVAAHHQEFERVVEAGGVGLPIVDQRPDLLQILAEQGRGNAVLAGANPVDVAAQGVDLAVVRDHAERVGQIPGRESVGRKTLMHEGERGDEALVAQVAEVLADLIGQQHTLVDDGARRQRRHVEHLDVGQLERLHAVAGFLADDIKLALQGVGVLDAFAATDENLADHRFDILGGLGQAPAIHRNVAPAEQRLALVADRALDRRLASAAALHVARQEDHADAILADRRQIDTLTRHLLAQEGIGNLDQDAGTVAEQRIVAGGAAMLEILEDLQPLRNDRMALLILDVGDEADAAGVMLVGGVVETLAAGLFHLAVPGSTAVKKTGAEGPSLARQQANR